MSLSNFAEKKINDYLFGGTSFTPPATYYIALLTAAPSESGTYSEANYTGYSRVAVANNKTNFTTAADDGNATITNQVEIRFPVATGGSSTVTHVALFDAASGGNMWAYGTLAISKNYTAGDRPVFEIGALVFTID